LSLYSQDNPRNPCHSEKNFSTPKAICGFKNVPG
jgi:hypothetical protein